MAPPLALEANARLCHTVGSDISSSEAGPLRGAINVPPLGGDMVGSRAAGGQGGDGGGDSFWSCDSTIVDRTLRV